MKKNVLILLSISIVFLLISAFLYCSNRYENGKLTWKRETGAEQIDKKSLSPVIAIFVPFLGFFNEGLARVEKNGKWGFIDKTGKEVIPCIYDGAWFFNEGLALVEKNGFYGFIDKTGKFIPYIYDAVVSRKR